jgi:hypothetical protein
MLLVPPRPKAPSSLPKISGLCSTALEQLSSASQLIITSKKDIAGSPRKKETKSFYFWNKNKKFYICLNKLFNHYLMRKYG